MHIRDPIHGSIEIDAAERRVIDSRYYQRLRHIKQLGFSDLAFPGATHSRYSHGIGAMWVASRLFDALYRDLPMPAADKARLDWKRIQAANVAAIRDADVINRFTALTHLQRASARVVRSVMTDHSTFATFLDTDGYIMRWQRLMILFTLVLSTLLTSIWFYCASPAPFCFARAR
jgi:hypothetical protein